MKETKTTLETTRFAGSVGWGGEGGLHASGKRNKTKGDTNNKCDPPLGKRTRSATQMRRH